MSDSVRPRRRQPTRLPCPWDSPGKNTGVGCHFLLQCMKVKSESKVATPWTVAYQAPPSMGFSRQEYWSGVPLPSPLMHMSIGLLYLTYCWVPGSSRSHKTRLRLCHPAKPYKPITPLFLSGWLRFYQSVFLSYFSKSSKVSLVCSVGLFDGILLKPKADKSYKHKNQ